MFNKNNQQTTATISLYFCKKSWSNFRCKKLSPFFPRFQESTSGFKNLKAQHPSESSPVNQSRYGLRPAAISSRWSCGFGIERESRFKLRNSLVSQATLLMSFVIIKLSCCCPNHSKLIIKLSLTCLSSCPFQQPHWLPPGVRLFGGQDCSLSHLRSVDMHK